ncbi:hypothetical protein HDV63DRAFT_381867 [Trichoderma sp. SZMC 28014]
MHLSIYNSCLLPVLAFSSSFSSPRGGHLIWRVREEKPVHFSLSSPLLAIDVRGPCWPHSFPHRAYPELQLLFTSRSGVTAHSVRLARVTCGDLPRALFPLSDIDEESLHLCMGRQTCILLQLRSESKRMQQISGCRHDEKRLRVQLDAAGEAGPPLRRRL